ncbi:hypothetical protein [Dyadobacter sp. CY312]|uniref:hypothetical protein n=1 Tax=Dyadobacter sp. CY312 TaxID=2907303 RepID=UPI001F3AB9E8|nr:hypothetical protein [Dyadobacter sp. CY312]MCE7039004.1 hypothetical protein [Dyadobacter sp. CY312]
MNPDVQKNLKRLAFAAGVVILFLLLAMFTVWLQKRSIEQTVQDKFDRFSQPTPTIIIPMYDSITEAKLDSISSSRQIAHKLVDDLHDQELQRAIDSVFNHPK